MGCIRVSAKLWWFGITFFQDISEMPKSAEHFNIELIAPMQTIDLRHRVLRAHQPRSACHDPGDDDVDRFHVGARMQRASFALSRRFLTKRRLFAERPARTGFEAWPPHRTFAALGWGALC